MAGAREGKGTVESASAREESADRKMRVGRETEGRGGEGRGGEGREGRLSLFPLSPVPFFFLAPHTGYSTTAREPSGFEGTFQRRTKAPAPTTSGLK